MVPCLPSQKIENHVSLKNQKKWIISVGVGGCGMSALAMLAVKQGYEVSGSDLVWSRFMDKLQEAGVRLHICHSVSHLQRHNDTSEIIGWEFDTHHKLIAVSGSHGKSTTTAMLAYVLNAMGDDLTAIVGADVPQFTGGNIISGSSETFVLEADEYDGCFLQLSPQIAVTIGDGTRSVMPISSSEQCADNYKITTYGISSSNDWQASSITQNSKGGVDYTVCHWGCPVADISLQISGIHNILNSLAVALEKFRGLSRRFEMIGSIHGCHVFDDYAHHPTEIRAVLQAARQRFHSKALLVVFQPHSFSRLAALKNDFAVALSDADQVIITKVYAARETQNWNVNGKDLSALIIGPPSEYIPSLEDVVNKLVLQICEDPHREIVILTLGSGDTTTFENYHYITKLEVSHACGWQVANSFCDQVTPISWIETIAMKLGKKNKVKKVAKEIVGGMKNFTLAELASIRYFIIKLH
ncbi:hypothetical protein F8388_026986 [Cannabis sativa]|uniref:UDP-N-acetylmuramate--L-alanine ligase n=1 Tax=Cannabis sativa TaxID=3483 RepID=A0A7J6EDV5_CANSA|nr:hypothetical protein F8388_026986 [Cannabis sativa]